MVNSYSLQAKSHHLFFLNKVLLARSHTHFLIPIVYVYHPFLIFIAFMKAMPFKAPNFLSFSEKNCQPWIKASDTADVTKWLLWSLFNLWFYKSVKAGSKFIVNAEFASSSITYLYWLEHTLLPISRPSVQLILPKYPYVCPSALHLSTTYIFLVMWYHSFPFPY